MDQVNEVHITVMVPEDIVNEANDAVFHLLPNKSKYRYLKEMTKFRSWMELRKVRVVTEEVMVAYFNGLIEKYSPSSLWSTYFMFRLTVFVYEQIDIRKFKTIFAILKSKSNEYQPKKAKTFDPKDVEQFMNEAPDEKYLLM
ncbi:hypothetical protein RN001_013512 [Aquatica leii]|uniref:Uncharacterized protein n=1 Tax=Aquatica leii TaxID=1421715 RepID=A0AAN7P053_9COLE|nr:hypothetical protein RN001_013512 [Aquatica leii]